MRGILVAVAVLAIGACATSKPQPTSDSAMGWWCSNDGVDGLCWRSEVECAEYRGYMAGNGYNDLTPCARQEVAECFLASYPPSTEHTARNVPLCHFTHVACQAGRELVLRSTSDGGPAESAGECTRTR
jgi:hypothetical protein